MMETVYAISKSVNLHWTYEQYCEHAALDTSVYIVEQQGFIALSVLHDEAEIINIAVTPTHQGKGLANKLMRQAKTIFNERGVKKCFLEVRASNQRAQRFYEKHGFLVIGNRKNYYSEPKEDAIIYCWEKV